MLILSCLPAVNRRHLPQLGPGADFDQKRTAQRVKRIPSLPGEPLLPLPGTPVSSRPEARPGPGAKRAAGIFSRRSRSSHPDHGHFDQVGGRALNRRISCHPLGKRAPLEFLLRITGRYAAMEEGGNITLLPASSSKLSKKALRPPGNAGNTR